MWYMIEERQLTDGSWLPVQAVEFDSKRKAERHTEGFRAMFANHTRGMRVYVSDKLPEGEVTWEEMEATDDSR